MGMNSPMMFEFFQLILDFFKTTNIRLESDFINNLEFLIFFLMYFVLKIHLE